MTSSHTSLWLVIIDGNGCFLLVSELNFAWSFSRIASARTYGVGDIRMATVFPTDYKCTEFTSCFQC